MQTPESEAEALLDAISTLLPYASGSAAAALRRCLRELVSNGEADPERAQKILRSSDPPAPRSTRSRPAAKRSGNSPGGSRPWADPSWPSLREKLRGELAARDVTLASLARSLGLSLTTLSCYLSSGSKARVPDAASKTKFVAWLHAHDGQLSAELEKAAQAKGGRLPTGGQPTKTVALADAKARRRRSPSPDRFITPAMAPPPDPTCGQCTDHRAPAERICCWENGVKGDRGWWCCDREALPGRPWCAAHIELWRVGKLRGRFYAAQVAGRKAGRGSSSAALTAYCGAACGLAWARHTGQPHGSSTRDRINFL